MPLLTIKEDENGIITISRPPFETVFKPEEWREVEEFVMGKKKPDPMPRQGLTGDR
jgi:hypothetical protein